MAVTFGPNSRNCHCLQSHTLLWAVLRNLGIIFGPRPPSTSRGAAGDLLGESTHFLATSLSRAVLGLASAAAVGNVMAALGDVCSLSQGQGLLPLINTLQPTPGTEVGDGLHIHILCLCFSF